MKNYFKNAQWRFFLLLFIVFSTTKIFAQYNQQVNLDTVKAQRFDTGKMWTFDYPPFEYFKQAYNFTPTQKWFDNVRLSALRIPGCTASFVSADGLIMTNQHCADFHLPFVQKKGENLRKTGFYAATLKDERKTPGMYADQLVLIKDVTDSVQNAMNKGKTDEEKAKLRDKEIQELQTRYNKKTGLNTRVVSLYNGGRFSIYGYKRYNDVRLVFVPEKQTAYFGGDYDNFTYPRYDLDISFFRVYDDNGKPLKPKHFFKFSENGIQKGEPVFTVGNPGRTSRLKTVAQLKYYRDVVYKTRSYQFDNMYRILGQLKIKYPKRADEFENMRTRIGNAQKVIHYIYLGLENPYLIARKQAFQNKLKNAVDSNPEMKAKYGAVWTGIASVVKEATKYDKKINAYSLSRFFSSKYFFVAKNLVKLAKQLKLPEDKREESYKSGNLDSTIAKIFPSKFDYPIENTKLFVQAGVIRMNLGNQDSLVQYMFGNNIGEKAVDYVLNKSKIKNKAGVMNLVDQGPAAILKSNDPFIYFIIHTQNKLKKLSKLSKAAHATESVLENMLGQAMYAVYGTSIPPDANFTLRISDGVLKSFAYNGTIAIPKTTFYGLYNRYYGADEQYPWSLPQRWLEPHPGFKLSTTLDFITTNDIVGGNSGSAIINENAKLVGIAFDGNIKSIIGNFIYMPKDNRAVAVSAQGILEALKYVYKADRLYNELKNGKR